MNKNLKIFFLIFIIILLLNIIFFSLSENINYSSFHKNFIENYENENDNNETIISNLDGSSGFYSVLFFIMNHYLYCKKNNKHFKIDSNGWLFKAKDGWTDYFEDIELNKDFSSDTNIKNHGFSTIISDYSIKDYKNIIPDFYIYNENTKKEIQKIKLKFNLIDNEYDSIFIRRGDKLGWESDYIKEDDYINLLLKKNKNCKIIFLQTDDYNCFLNLEKYIKNNNLNIKLYTICDKNSVGSITFNYNKDILKDSSIYNTSNKDYLSTIINKLDKTKSVNEMNKEEIYDHTLKMIVGIDVVLKSKFCITDYQSNVGRFIKLAHNNSDNVFNVLDENNDIDYLKKTCPSHDF
jgi:hypothetical protein